MRGGFLPVVIAAIAFASVPASAHAATKPADAAIVKAGLLSVNDFPPGWTETPRRASPEPDLSKYGKTCAAIQRSWNTAKKLPTARANSPNFKQGTALIQDTVTTHRTAAAARAAVAYLKVPGFTACLQRYNTDRLNTAARNGVTYKTSHSRLSDTERWRQHPWLRGCGHVHVQGLHLRGIRRGSRRTGRAN